MFPMHTDKEAKVSNDISIQQRPAKPERNQTDTRIDTEASIRKYTQMKHPQRQPRACSDVGNPAYVNINPSPELTFH